MAAFGRSCRWVADSRGRLQLAKVEVRGGQKVGALAADMSRAERELKK
jgi:hypothetical protein